MRETTIGRQSDPSSLAPEMSVGVIVGPSRHRARVANVRFPLPISAFRAQGRLGQLSAINRHNQQLFDHLVGAQQNRWLAPEGDDGRFDIYVAMNGRSDWHDLERPGRRFK